MNYQEDIGYRGAVIYERTGVMPKNVDEILAYDPLLEHDIAEWLELFKFFRS